MQIHVVDSLIRIFHHPQVRLRTVCTLLLSCWMLQALPAETQVPRKVIIDQDAFESPGMQPMLMILQDPSVEVLAITTVSGDGWQPAETAKTLRMLELIGRTDIPVVAGATYPLINNKQAVERREALYGELGYKGAWTEKWPEHDDMERPEYHGPEHIPTFPEGQPSTEPYPGSAAEFMLAKSREFPGEITIIAMGPLTNLALAQRLDPGFAPRIKELVTMGGYFNLPLTGKHTVFTTQVAYSPRMTFNPLWDPEAAHIVFTSPWTELSMVSGDASVGIHATQAMLDRISESDSPVAKYVTMIGQAGFQLWDEAQAAAWLDPDLITVEKELMVGIDLMPGMNYGAILTWPEGRQPGIDAQSVRVILRVDPKGLEAMFVDRLSRP